MNYPHWFCYLLTEDWMRFPCAVMLISEEQATCAVHKYVEKKGYWANTTPFTKYDGLHDLLRNTGFAKEDLIILTDDDSGKCIAFTYCDKPGGRCDVDYYECGCFV